MMRTSLTVVAFVAGLAAARADDVTRIRGTIEAADGTTMTLKPRTGEPVKLTLADDAKVFAATTGKLTDVKPDSYIGTAAIPQPDGTQKALQVTVFAPSLRGTADGHYPWDLGSGSTMTNGAVGTLSGTSGRTMKVEYKGGEKTIVVPEDVPVTLVDPGDKSLLVAGSKVVAFVKQAADGKRDAVLLIVGRNGTVPSM